MSAFGEETVGNMLSHRETCETCGRERKSYHSPSADEECAYRDCEGGPVLDQYERRARDRLREVPSDVCQRLANYIENTYWSPGIHEFYSALEMTEGDIVIRVSDDAPGSLWLFWAGTPLDTRFYKCVSTLPHHQGYKVVSARNGHPKRFRSKLEDNYPRPTHIDDVPEPVRAVMANERPYPDEWSTETENEQ